MEPSVFWDYLVNFVFPFGSFVAGVLVADRLKLYPALGPKEHYLMAVPVGLLTVGAIIAGASMVLGDVTYYAYTRSGVGSYLTFCGVITFHGMLVPELFDIFRRKFARPGPV